MQPYEQLEHEIEYREVKGFSGYRVGNDGSIWTAWKQRGKGMGRGSYRYLSDGWTKMKCSPDKDGYLQVSLVVGEKRKKAKVHRLVLEAFVGTCPEGWECRHYPDKDPTNNYLTNLSWTPHSQNERDKSAHGTSACGEKNHFAKLTEDTVRKIRMQYAKGGYTMKTLALLYKTTAPTVCVIVNKKTWRHVV